MCEGGRRILQFIPSSRPHLFTHSLIHPLHPTVGVYSVAVEQVLPGILWRTTLTSL